MWFVRAICDEGYAVQERRAWRDEDVEFCKHELKTLYPNHKIVVETYVPWTKERAEEEIARKLAAQKKQSKKNKKEEA